MPRARRGRGEGSIFERGDGTWSAEISLGYDAGGRRRRKTVYGRTKAEVLQKLDRLRSEARVGSIADAGDLTVGQLLDRWLAATEGQNAASTAEQRERLVRVHIRPRLGQVRLAKLSPLHVEGLYAELRADKVGGWAIRHVADALSIALNCAVRWKLIPHNPAVGVPKPRPQRREMLTLTEAHVRAILATAAGSASSPLLATALGTGCRLGELLGLSWQDLDLRGGVLNVRRSLSETNAGHVLKDPKTKAGRRTIELPAFTVEALTARKADALKAGLLSAPVFCTRTGGYLERRNVLRAFRGIVKRANEVAVEQAEAAGVGPDLVPEKIRFHDLRHTVASNLLSKGHSLRAVSQRLGHSNAAMTLSVYAHCLPTDDRQLAEGLGRLFG